MWITHKSMSVHSHTCTWVFLSYYYVDDFACGFIVLQIDLSGPFFQKVSALTHRLICRALFIQLDMYMGIHCVIL